MNIKISNVLAPALIALLAASGPGSAQRADDAAALEAADNVETVLDRWNEDPSQVFDATGIDLEDLRFVARPVVVFADSPLDPDFSRQIDLLMDRPGALIARDVIILVDTDPEARSEARQTLRPRGFSVILLGKDGRVAQRKPVPLDVRDLERAIDKLPIRLQELSRREE